VVQKALRQSVRVEVQVGGKVVRAASGVVVAADDGHSYVLTNQHVCSAKGSAAPRTSWWWSSGRSSTAWKRSFCRGRGPGRRSRAAQHSEQLTPVPIATEDDVQVGDDVVVVARPTAGP